MLWFKLFLPFAGAYFLSYHFRTINAVVGPILSTELSLGAADLGLLTSAYFVAFGAAQLPLGVLLDRFGARRVESLLLIVAAAGAAIFANAHSIGMLALGRGLIGIGVSACLMASFKSFSQWFPPEKMPSLTGWIMTSGTLGAFVSTVPLDAVLHFSTWREIFLMLAAVTVIMSAWIFFGVPDKPGIPQPDPLSAQWSGIREVLASTHFWWIAPVGLAQIGGFMAVQSLWSSAWLIHVNGYTRTQAADHLAAMNVGMIAAYALIGLVSTGLARKGISTLALLSGGMLMALVSLILIITETSTHHLLLWTAYGVFSSTGTLSYALLSSGFPTSLSGRVNTTYNLMCFAGAFGFQWGMGLLIDLLQAREFIPAEAHRYAFILLIACQCTAWLWLVFGKRYRQEGRAA